MKNFARILCIVLAMTMLLSGCKIVLPGTGSVAATYGDGQTISTGEYLAYLYLYFEDTYSSQAPYAQYYGVSDPWDIELPYGEDGKTKLAMDDYITTMAQDAIKRNIVLAQMMKDNNLSYIEADKKDIDKEMSELAENAYLPAGVSNENFIKAYTALMLNQRSTFFGLYGEGGPKAVANDEIRKYFDNNYLSYKIITVSLTKTGSDNKTVALSADEKAAELKKLNEYLTICNDKGFEAAKDAYNKANAKEGDEVKATTDEDNRVNSDATEMDEALVKAIRSVEVGKAKIVEYGGEDEKNPTTAALIMRLDTNNPGKVYDDAKESILITLKSEEFEKDLNAAVEKLVIEFNKKTVKKCDPKKFAG